MRSYVVNARFAGMRMTGVQRSAYEISWRLAAKGSIDYHLVSPRFDGNEVLINVFQHGRIRHGHLWEQLELPGVMRDIDKKAVLYSPMTSGPIAVRRQVMTLHDLFVIEHPEWFSKTFRRWYALLLPTLLRRVAYVVANSEYTRRNVLERYGLPEDKVVTCHFAQDERFTPPSADKVEQFRAEQGLPERYVLFLGSIEPRKNLLTLLSAWKRVQAREEGVKLVIAGGAGRADIFSASNLDRDLIEDSTVQRLGYFSDESLPLLYGAAEAFALPSLAEGFGLPVLEAMACGTPVICSDNTALPEISGGAALLAPSFEVEAWVEAIDRLLSSAELRSRMSEAGLYRASEFSWDSTADKVQSVLEGVA